PDSVLSVWLPASSPSPLLPFLQSCVDPPALHSFPTRRSSDLLSILTDKFTKNAAQTGNLDVYRLFLLSISSRILAAVSYCSASIALWRLVCSCSSLRLG